MRKHYAKWVYEALKDHQGSATVLEVAKHIWHHHKDEIEGTKAFIAGNMTLDGEQQTLERRELCLKLISPKEGFGN